MLTRSTLCLIGLVISVSIHAQQGVGVNTDSIRGQLHITTNSTLGYPQLRLTETQDDYGRIKFESTAYPDSYWDFAASSGTDSTGGKFMNMYFFNGSQGKDLFMLRGTGDLYRDSYSNTTYNLFRTQGGYRGGLGFDSTDFKLFTTYSDGKIRMGTKFRDNFVIDALGRVGVGISSPDTLDAHVQFTNSSTTTIPSLRIRELGYDYSRVRFDNTTYPNSHWTMAVVSGDTVGVNWFNFFYQNQAGSRDVLRLHGEGNLYRNTNNSYLYDYYQRDGVSKGFLGLADEDFIFKTRTTSKGKISLGTRHGNHIVIDTLGDVDINGEVNVNDKLYVNNHLYVPDYNIYVGDFEFFADAGSYMTRHDGGLRSTVNGGDDLGTSTHRWQDIWASNGTIQTSDARDKKSIQNLEYGLSTVMQLRAVSYEWKDRPEEGTKLGLVAQEVLELIPEVVKTHDYQRTQDGGLELIEADRLGMYYSDLIPVLIKSIQDQNQLIEDLEAENQELKETQMQIIAALEEAGISIDN